MAITHETQNLPIIENKGSFPLNDALGGSSGTIIYALLKRNLTSQIRNPMYETYLPIDISNTITLVLIN